jgi:O-antigen ligase
MTPIGLWRDKTLQFVFDRRLTFLRIGIISGLILVALATGKIVNRSGSLPEMTIFAVFLALGGMIFYRSGHMENGILAIMITACMLNFFTLPTGTQSRIVISLLLSMALVGYWVIRLFQDRQTQLKSTPVNRPLLLFVMISLISYGWSTILRDPIVTIWPSFPMVQLAALAVNILLPLLVLFTANTIKETVWLKRMTWILIVMGAIVVVGNIFSLHLDRLYHNGSSGLFATWVGTMAYGMFLFNQKLSRWIRILLVVLLAGWIRWTFVRDIVWLSGWLPLFVSLIALTFFLSKKLFVVLLFAGVIFFSLNFNKYYQSIYVSNMNEGSGQRLELWQNNWELVIRHPLFGVGPAGYAPYYLTYHPLDARSTHNNYFDVLSQTGFIGFGIFLWMMGSLLLIGNRTRQILKGRRDFEEAFANSVLAGNMAVLAGMMLGDWVLPFAYNQTITGFDNASFTWIFLGGLVSLFLIVKSRENERLSVYHLQN